MGAKAMDPSANRCHYSPCDAVIARNATNPIVNFLISPVVSILHDLDEIKKRKKKKKIAKSFKYISDEISID